MFSSSEIEFCSLCQSVLHTTISVDMFYADSADKNVTRFLVSFVNLFLGFSLPYVFALETAQLAFEECCYGKDFRYMITAELNLNKMTS